MARDRQTTLYQPRKGELNHCSPAEPEQHFETKAMECCSFSPIVRPWSSGNRGYEKIHYLNNACQNAGFSLRSWKNRGKSSKTTGRRVVSHLKGHRGARIWEGKARWYPDRDTVFHGPASWPELERWVSELRNFPRFFHDFSTIRVTKHKKSPCFIAYEKW